MLNQADLSRIDGLRGVTRARSESTAVALQGKEVEMVQVGKSEGGCLQSAGLTLPRLIHVIDLQ